MNEMNEQNPIENAIAARLARLRTRPVDLSRLKQAVEREVPKPHSRLQRIMRLHPIRSIAALLLLGMTVAVLIVATSGGPALASTDELLRLHTTLVQNATPMTNVSSMEAANAALAGKWPDAPQMPDVPDHEVMSCCVHHMGKAKAACVLLAIDGVPVTMAGADSAKVRMPQMQVIERGGTEYHVQSSQGVSMVMTQRDGKWYCLMGKLSAERLLQFWSELKPAGN